MTTLQFVQSVLDWLLADPSHVIAAASALAAMTPTPDPRTVQGKIYRLVDIFALNFLHAKEGGAAPGPAPSAPPQSPPGATGSLLVLLAAGCAFGLGACATADDPAQTVYALEATYNSLAQVEVSYEKSPAADATVVAAAKQLDQAAYDALVAARSAAESGNATTLTTALAACQNALDDFSAYLTQKGLTP